MSAGMTNFQILRANRVAAAALDRVSGTGSEWRELWEEEDSLAELTVLDSIRDHL